MIKNLLMSLSFLWSSLAVANNVPGVYELATYCPQGRRPCGVIIGPKVEGSSDEYVATIWLGDPSISKTISLSKNKFKHIDRTFHLFHLWKTFKEGSFPLDKLPKNDKTVLLNVKNHKGQYHLLVPRYNDGLNDVQKLVLDWEAFLKAQVMMTNTMQFKKDSEALKSSKNSSN